MKQELFEIIYDFSQENRPMWRYAKRKHDDTKAIRKVSKEPYFVHPEGVAKIIQDLDADDVTIKAALAHDLIEDAGATYDDIKEKFGKEVADIVNEVTNDNYLIRKIGKEKYISDELIHLSPKALIVKLGDMLYNIEDHPTEQNYKRMKNNVLFLISNRNLNGIALKLATRILAQ